MVSLQINTQQLEQMRPTKYIIIVESFPLDHMSSICQYHNGKVMYFFIGIVITYVSVFGGLNVRRDMSLKCQMGLHAKHSNSSTLGGTSRSGTLWGTIGTL